jgi:hypothetical protein
MSGLWGWDGWIVVALIPLAFLALVGAFAFLVFHQDPATVTDPIEDPAADAAADDSALGWRAPVPSNDERSTGTRPRPRGPRAPRSGRS